MEGWVQILFNLSLASVGGLLLAVGIGSVIDSRLMPRSAGLVLLGLGCVLVILYGTPGLVSQMLNRLQ